MMSATSSARSSIESSVDCLGGMEGRADGCALDDGSEGPATGNASSRRLSAPYSVYDRTEPARRRGGEGNVSERRARDVSGGNEGSPLSVAAANAAPVCECPVCCCCWCCLRGDGKYSVEASDELLRRCRIVEASDGESSALAVRGVRGDSLQPDWAGDLASGEEECCGIGSSGASENEEPKSTSHSAPKTLARSICLSCGGDGLFCRGVCGKVFAFGPSAACLSEPEERLRPRNCVRELRRRARVALASLASPPASACVYEL